MKLTPFALASVRRPGPAPEAPTGAAPLAPAAGAVANARNDFSKTYLAN